MKKLVIIRNVLAVLLVGVIIWASLVIIAEGMDKEAKLFSQYAPNAESVEE